MIYKFGGKNFYVCIPKSFIPKSQILRDVSVACIHIGQDEKYSLVLPNHILADQTRSKRPGTSYQVQIHFAVVNHLYISFVFLCEIC